MARIPKTSILGLRVSDDLKARIERLAEARRLNLTDIVHLCIYRSLPGLEVEGAGPTPSTPGPKRRADAEPVPLSGDIPIELL